MSWLVVDRAFIDTNILLDMMVPGRPESGAALELAEKVSEGAIEGLVSAGSLKDIYYICRKRFDDAFVREYIRIFLALFTVVPIDASICAMALDSNEPDFEDGLVRAQAESQKAAFIVSRDADAYRGCSARRVDARMLLEHLA